MFAPASLRFLRGLAANNRKEWFEARRETYEREVRAPLRELVEEMDVRLATVAPEIVGDTKRSLFRIHRDVRFSRDKSPYKTHAACWFFHRAAGRSAAP
ncbi:MAG: TIGR02453 family protein, partial [Gemmatimonadaceae bacterium]